jgi:DNA repair protein RadC
LLKEIKMKINEKIMASESFSDMDKFYYFDFVEAANGSFFMRISRNDHKEDDTYERHAVVIFQENFEFAMEALTSMFRTAGLQLRKPQDEQTLNGIKSWNPECRPREKMMAEGREAMADTELLAMLIGSGTPRESAVGLAARILHAIGHDLIRLATLTMEELCVFSGMGRAKSSTIISAMELGRRIAAIERDRFWLKTVQN